jgi:hypothetical protein
MLSIAVNSRAARAVMIAAFCTLVLWNHTGVPAAAAERARGHSHHRGH